MARFETELHQSFPKANQVDSVLKRNLRNVDGSHDKSLVCGDLGWLSLLTV